MVSRSYKTLKVPQLGGKLGPKATSVNGCYFERLGECIPPLSAEHFISKNILVKIGGISSKGIPWLSSLGIDLPPDALKVKCLCKGHNSFLAPLDTFAGELFDEVDKFWKLEKQTINVGSQALEHWMLKCLCGLISTGKIEFNGKKFSQTDIKNEWLNVLLGNSTLSNGLGLYIHFNLGDKIDTNKTIAIAPQFIENSLAGLRLEFRGITFMLSLVPPEAAFKKPIEETNILYQKFTIKNDSKNSRLIFSN